MKVLHISLEVISFIRPFRILSHCSQSFGVILQVLYFSFLVFIFYF